MVQIIKIILQYMAIGCFTGLTAIGVIQKDWNFGFGVNIALVILYIFLYLQPIK